MRRMGALRPDSMDMQISLDPKHSRIRGLTSGIGISAKAGNTAGGFVGFGSACGTGTEVPATIHKNLYRVLSAVQSLP